jgi:hypothetical protein
MGERAQHAVATDRFAREIVRILAVCVARLRRLNGRPFGRLLKRMPLSTTEIASQCGNGLSATINVRIADEFHLATTHARTYNLSGASVRL